MTSYNYAIIKENYAYLQQESVLNHNNYKKSKKYAFICFIGAVYTALNIVFEITNNENNED